MRLSGGKSRFQWVGGGFYSHNKRDYGQNLLVSGFEDLTGIPTAGLRGAGKDVLFFSDLHYKLEQFALFGEGTLTVERHARASPPACATTTSTRTATQIFDGIFADNNGTSPYPAGLDRRRRLRAALHRQLQGRPTTRP